MGKLRYRQSLWPLLLLAISFLNGCALGPSVDESAHRGEPGAVGRCADYFMRLDQVITQASVNDAGTGRIQGYPYLRINRLLASMRNEVEAADQFEIWLGHLQALSVVARAREIKNLPATSVLALSGDSDRATLVEKMRHCGQVLKQADFKTSVQRQQLRERAVVADEYHWLPRILGLYPLSRMFVSMGVEGWHEEARQRFSNTAPQAWNSRTYAPPLRGAGDRDVVAGLLRRVPRDALGYPRYSVSTLKRLFAFYAPVWKVRQRSTDDRIGAPEWRRPGQVDVAVRDPVTYTHLSFTRFQGELLTQLNYIIWFPARTPQHWLDIYAGPIDGVNLRITLSADGNPLLYETIHNCGCYYKAYPTRRLQTRKSIDYPEPPLILTAPQLDSSSPLLMVAMQSASHFVVHLYSGNRKSVDQASPYRLDDYAQLLSLDDGVGGRASLFDAQGMIAASDRPERYLLWPTGVSSPGAMRQWGRHAVAFVGERHFDDADAMQRMFIAVPSP